MAKILLIVAIAISLVTAGLGFVNRQTLIETKAELETKTTSLNNTTKKLADVEGQLKEATAAAETATADKEQIAADLAAAQSELETAKKAAADATAQLSAKETEIASLNQRIEELESMPQPDSGGPQQPVGEDPRVAELEAVVESQNQKLAQVEAQLATYKEQEKARQTKQMQQGLEGRVLAVNPAWNFVVLSIGDRAGVVNNAELLLKRGNQYLGKVRVTSVEPSTSIADIVANTLPPGVSVQPGDSVIYQGTSEN